jgi:beta-glucanase (GH16 family)
MKKKILIIAVFFLWHIGLWAQSPLNDKNWQIDATKSDEFNSTTLNSKWDKLSGLSGWTNFDPNYVSVDGSNLKLKLDKVGSTYYTGGVQTHNFDYLNGYFEMEAVLPYGKLWPTFWIWGANGLQSYTEFDILEPNGDQYQYANRNVYGFWYKPPSHVPCTSVPGDPNYMNGCDVKVEFDKTGISNMSTNTHKYALEWHPHQAIFYLDDVPIGSAYNDARVPFDIARIMIDLQIDGGHPPDPSTLVPQYMSINYFRYYRLKTDCNIAQIVTANNFDFTNAANLKLKKSYTITSSMIPSGSNVTIRATDFIEMGNGFEVPANTEFNAVTTPCY